MSDLKNFALSQNSIAARQRLEIKSTVKHLQERVIQAFMYASIACHYRTNIQKQSKI